MTVMSHGIANLLHVHFYWNADAVDYGRLWCTVVLLCAYLW